MNDNIKILIHRLADLFITSLVLSALLTVLNRWGILNERQHLALALIIGSVIFFALNVKMLRGCYFVMSKHPVEYYLLNSLAYLLFAIVSFVVYRIFSEEVYVWFFAVTKFVRFTSNGVETVYSAILFHFLGFISVFFAPAGITTDGFDER